MAKLIQRCLANCVRFFVFTFIFCCIQSHANEQTYRTELPDELDDSGWELMMDEEGTKIFKRDWPGSSFVAVKAVQIVQSSLSNIIGNYSDIAAFPDWVEDMEDAYLVEPFDETRSRKVYMRMGLPWPLQDRDMAMGQQLTQDPVSKIVRIREWNEGDTVPENKGVMRIPRLNSEVVLFPESKTRTKMIWQGHNEPGGLIPPFLVNWLIENVFYKSMKSMKDRYEDPKYHKSPDWVADF